VYTIPFYSPLKPVRDETARSSGKNTENYAHETLETLEAGLLNKPIKNLAKHPPNTPTPTFARAPHPTPQPPPQHNKNHTPTTQATATTATTPAPQQQHKSSTTKVI